MASYSSASAANGIWCWYTCMCAQFKNDRIQSSMWCRIGDESIGCPSALRGLPHFPPLWVSKKNASGAQSGVSRGSTVTFQDEVWDLSLGMSWWCFQVRHVGRLGYSSGSLRRIIPMIVQTAATTPFWGCATLLWTSTCRASGLPVGTGFRWCEVQAPMR